MSKNKTLSAAKSAKNDEFYTQYADIQKSGMQYEILERNTKGGNGVLETLEERLRREEPGAEFPEGVLRRVRRGCRHRRHV